MTSADSDILKSPTVLVLGAGASCPYGFPLGPQLKPQILSKRNDTATRKQLSSLGFEDSLVDDFYEKLQRGGHSTIDIFLEKKPNFRDLGAHLIADTIMPYEHRDSLFPQTDWYGSLFDAMDFEREEPDVSLLSIVSLNYDRSLEHFLNQNIDYRCSDDRVEFAHQKQEGIRIVHAHGSFGAYPDVPYGLPVNADTLRDAAASIKIVSDHLEDSPDYQKAQQLISSANHIVFLGFGYNQATMTTLLATTQLDRKHLRGTSYGLVSTDIDRLKSSYGKQMLQGDNRNCGQLLADIGLTGRNL